MVPIYCGWPIRIELNVAKLEINGELLEMQVLDTTSNPALWSRGAFDEFFDAVEAVVLVCNAHDSASIAGIILAVAPPAGMAQPLMTYIAGLVKIYVNSIGQLGTAARTASGSSVLCDRHQGRLAPERSMPR